MKTITFSNEDHQFLLECIGELILELYEIADTNRQDGNSEVASEFNQKAQRLEKLFNFKKGE